MRYMYIFRVLWVLISRKKLSTHHKPPGLAPGGFVLWMIWYNECMKKYLLFVVLLCPVYAVSQDVNLPIQPQEPVKAACAAPKPVSKIVKVNKVAPVKMVGTYSCKAGDWVLTWKAGGGPSGNDSYENESWKEWQYTTWYLNGVAYKKVSCLAATSGGTCDENDNMVIKKTDYRTDDYGMIVAEDQYYPQESKHSLAMFAYDKDMNYCCYCICNGEDIATYGKDASCKKCTYYGAYQKNCEGKRGSCLGTVNGW